jgi:exonuclease III
MANGIKVMSYNVKGLKGQEKRQKVMTWLCEKKPDIIMIQESHYEEKHRKEWKDTWKGEIYASEGRGNSRGVCTLFKQGFHHKLQEEHKDKQGRWLILLVSINNENFCVANYYGPNQDDTTHLGNMLKKIDSMNFDHLIIGGDLNFVFNIKLDKLGGNNSTNEKCRNMMKRWMEKSGTIDCWRTLHPNEKQYTWVSNTLPRVHCRLDHLLISQELQRQITNCTINPSFQSDHASVSMNINFPKTHRGKGYWKFNSSYLGEEELDINISDCIRKTVEENRPCSHRLMWEILKCNIRRELIRYCCKKQKEKRSHERELERNLEGKAQDRVKATLQGQDTEKIEADIQNIKNELSGLIEEKCRGAALRSQAKNYELGEKATKYFSNLEKQKGEKQTISTLIKEDGTLTTNQDEILKEEYKFYNDLYRNKDTPHDSNTEREWNHLFNIRSPKVEEAVKEDLLKQISEDEIWKIIRNSPADKSPGIDGYTSEFYRYFWDELKTYLIPAYNEALQEGELGISQRRGCISLLPKEGKDLRYVKNWRPITLLNNDYKYLAKSLADRCRNILPSIINKDQNGFVKGRQIGSNIIRIIDMIESCGEEKIKGVMVNIDIEKAFDSISWNFLHKALDFFGFPMEFINWIKCLYKEGEVCVMNNGFTSEFIKIGRGMRQGCPLSPILFVISIELMSLYIKENHLIEGIEVAGTKHLVSQFADDTTFFLKMNQGNIKNLFEYLEKFGTLSGLKINISKTEILLLGTSNKEDLQLEYQDNIKPEVKVLGCNISKNLEETIRKNYEKAFSKLEGAIEFWSKKPLSLFGKINMLKCHIMPKLLYCITVLPSPPLEFWKKVQKSLHSFIANGKQEKIKRTTLLNQYHKGGAQMLDVEAQNAAIKCTWLIKAALQNGPWTYRLKQHLGQITIEELLTSNIRWEDIESKIPKNSMWYEAVKYWCKENYRKDPETPQDIRRERLWLNSNIRIQDKILRKEKWINNNILCIDDILQPNKKVLMPYRDFQQQHHTNIDFLEYGGVKKAIPGKWKQQLRDANIDADLEVHTKTLWEISTTGETKAKSLYKELVRKKASPPLNKMEDWVTELEIDIEPVKLFKLMEDSRRCTPYTKLQSFNYNFFVRNLSYGARLFHMKKEPSDRCARCNQKESIIHLYWECPDTGNIWDQLYEIIYRDIGVRKSKELCLLGIRNGDIENRHWKLLYIE